MEPLKVDILLNPQLKYPEIDSRINLAAKMADLAVKINKTTNFGAFSGMAINPSQTPVFIINGNVEFAGKVPELEILVRRFTEIKQGR